MALAMDLWQINNDQLEPMNKISLNLEKRLKKWMVRVKWIKTFNESNAKWFKGAFANQNVVCKLNDKDTFDFLVKEFQIDRNEL